MTEEWPSMAENYSTSKEMECVTSRRSGMLHRVWCKNERDWIANKSTEGSIAWSGRNWTDDTGAGWFNSLYGYALERGAERMIKKVWIRTQ